MGLFDLEQLGLIPAFFILLIGLLLHRGDDEQKREQRFLLFLLITGSLLLALLGVIHLPMWQNTRWPFQIARLVTLPAIGVLALTILHLPRLRNMDRKTITAVLLLLLFQLVLVIVLRNGRYVGLLILYLPTLITIIFWTIGRHYNRLAVMFGLLALGGLLILQYVFFTSLELTILSARYLGIPVIFGTPLLGIAAPAILITNGLYRWPKRDTAGKRGLFMSLALAILILGLVSLVIFWSAIWDQTQDLGYSFFLIPLITGTAVAVGMVMSVVLEGKQRLVGLLFMLLLPFLFAQLHNLGSTFAYHTYNEQGAARIATALADYYAREERYPATLASLSPQDLLVIPQPILLQGEQWCYQGGEDFYRLGAFYQERWAFPISLKVYASDGQAPPGEWACETMLAEVKSRHFVSFPDPGTPMPAPPLPTPLPESDLDFSRTRLRPLLNGAPIAAGNWSPDSAYYLFGEKIGGTQMRLHFLNGVTGETCEVPELFNQLEVLREHYAWLGDGRLLFLDSNGRLVILSPCQPEIEDITATLPETMTLIAAAAEGNFVLQGETRYWIGNGRNLSLQPIANDIVPPATGYWNNIILLPGGENVAISYFTRDGSELLWVSAETGAVEASFPLHHESDQSGPWIEALTPQQVLTQRTNGFAILDFSTDPPQETNVLTDIFGLNIDFPDEISASGSLIDEAGNLFLFVRLNHERDQRTYLYHAATGQVEIFDHDHHTLLLFPNGELIKLEKLSFDDSRFEDEFTLVPVGEPASAHRYFFFEGHTPREYPQLSIVYLAATEQIAVASAQGVSLVSYPDGELQQYWELEGEGFSPWLVAAPDGSSLIIVRDYGGLYWIKPE